MLLFQTITCFQENVQTCDFAVKSYHLGDVNQHLYSCRIKDARIEHDHTITHTEENQRSNDDVEAVSYESGNSLKLIPSSLFVSFPNMKLLRVLFCNLTMIRPYYFQNARHLTNIRITMNPIINLESDLFAEAPNVEYISLYKNKIESVHRLCFSGLKHLQRLDLDDNKIKNLHPTTFSNVMNLQFLNLNGNNCISRNYKGVNQNFRGIQREIKQKCQYDIIKEGVENNVPVKVVYLTTLAPRFDKGQNSYDDRVQMSFTESSKQEEKMLPIEPIEPVKEDPKEATCIDSCGKIDELTQQIQGLTKLSIEYKERVKALEEKLETITREKLSSNKTEIAVKCDVQCTELNNKFNELTNSFEDKLEMINATTSQNVQEISQEFKDASELCKDTYAESERNFALLNALISEQSKACDKKVKDSISKLEGKFEKVAKQFFASQTKPKA